MRAVTFQSPSEVRVEEKPEPEIADAREALVRVDATGICGSDLHIYHGRVVVEPGFTLGHEYVGTVVGTGDQVETVNVGDRVLGAFSTACGRCHLCALGAFHKCEHARVFGFGSTLGSLEGAQAELLLVPNADLTLRRVPPGIADEVALFAGDVLGTGYHAIAETGVGEGSTVAILGLGPVGLCAAQAAAAAGASTVLAIDSVDDRLRLAADFGASPVHLDEDPAAAVKAATGGRGVDVAVDAVGRPEALNLACRLARDAGTVSATGVYAEPIELHMGIVWIKALTLRTGLANVIAHLDPVLAALSSGELDPSPLVTHSMNLDEAAEAYEIYDRREALKIVLRP